MNIVLNEMLNSYSFLQIKDASYIESHPQWKNYCTLCENNKDNSFLSRTCCCVKKSLHTHPYSKTFLGVRLRLIGIL